MLKKTLLAAGLCLAVGTPVMAQTWQRRDFPSFSWDKKVRAVVEAGGKYRRDCVAVMSGQRGATGCLHVTEYQDGTGYEVTVRAAMVGFMRQWCIGYIPNAKMVCTDQDTGATTQFVLIDNVWHSVN